MLQHMGQNEFSVFFFSLPQVIQSPGGTRLLNVGDRIPIVSQEFYKNRPKESGQGESRQAGVGDEIPASAAGWAGAGDEIPTSHQDRDVKQVSSTCNLALPDLWR